MLKCFRYRRKMPNLRSSVLLIACFVITVLLYLFYARPLSPWKGGDAVKVTKGSEIAYCNSPGYVTGAENENMAGFTLKQLQVVIRHGDRGPIHPKALRHTSPVYISCSFNDTNLLQFTKLWNFREVINKDTFVVKGSEKKKLIDERHICKGGQLTPFGYLQHLFNGEHLKRSYKDFLSTIDLKSEIHIQATDVPRTIQSSSALVAGIFHDELTINTYNIPIYIHKDRVSSGHFLLDENSNDLHCPQLAEKTNHIGETPKIIHFYKNAEPMLQKMAQILLLKRESLPAFSYIVDILYTKLCHDQGLPRGPRAQLPGSLVKQTLQFSHMYSNVWYSALAELQTLSILSQIAKHALHMLLRGNNPKKLVLFSGHDSTIAPFLHILGVSDGKWPPYASRVVFEFYTRDSTYEKDLPINEKIKSTYFRVIYNGVADKQLKFCQSNDLPNLCALHDLFVYVSDGLYHDQLELIDDVTFRELLFSRIKSICSQDV